MKRYLSILLSVLMAVFSFCIAEETDEIETIVTIVPAPDQDKAERPPCFPDPADDFIPLPETE